MNTRARKVRLSAVKRVLQDPPYWIARSYLPAYESGRYTLEVLAFTVTAALGDSPYDEDAVDQTLQSLRDLGFREQGGASIISWIPSANQREEGVWT